MSKLLSLGPKKFLYILVCVCVCACMGERLFHSCADSWVDELHT